MKEPTTPANRRTLKRRLRRQKMAGWKNDLRGAWSSISLAKEASVTAGAQSLAKAAAMTSSTGRKA